MTLGQVVPNFTGQVVSSKILRIFRWKLWVILCSAPVSKWPWHKKTCRNKLSLSSGTRMFRLKDKFSIFRNFFDQWNFFIEHCIFLHFCSIEFGYHFSCNWMWYNNWPRLQGKLSQVIFPYKVVINNHSVTIEGSPILFNCSRGFSQNFGISQHS